MDKKFLNKVVNQIVSETRVNGETGRIKTLFRHLSYSFALHFQLPWGDSTSGMLQNNVILSSFSRHCKEVYGLDNDEVGYVWDKYVQIIRDKINNG
tara:strand:+ start:618 stop:905 length:288 start_codon:yes stop_codon:yes gene_type:complete